MRQQNHRVGAGLVDWTISMSLDHSVHFHRPESLRADEWMLVQVESAVSFGARGACVRARVRAIVNCSALCVAPVACLLRRVRRAWPSMIRVPRYYCIALQLRSLRDIAMK